MGFLLFLFDNKIGTESVKLQLDSIRTISIQLMSSLSHLAVQFSLIPLLCSSYFMALMSPFCIFSPFALSFDSCWSVVKMMLPGIPMTQHTTDTHWQRAKDKGIDYLMCLCHNCAMVIVSTCHSMHFHSKRHYCCDQYRAHLGHTLRLLQND